MPTPDPSKPKVGGPTTSQLRPFSTPKGPVALNIGA